MESTWSIMPGCMETGKRARLTVRSALGGLDWGTDFGGANADFDHWCPGDVGK